MPFTLTHIAAVVPIKKLSGTLLPFTALAIGSVVPDMPMFFNVPSGYSVTHSIPGLFTACLPIGILLYVVFQVLVRTALLEVMPYSISTRLGGRERHDLKYVAGIVFALLIGAATHVLWDSFTHGGNWGVQQVPVLKKTFVMFDRTHRYYKLLQHGSSVVFLPLMAYALFRWTRAPFVQPAKPYYSQLLLPLWIKLVGCFTIFVIPAIWSCTEAWVETHSVYYGIGVAARSYGRYMVIAAIGYSLFIQVAIWLRQREQVQTT